MNIVAEHIPPMAQIVGQMGELLWWICFLVARIEGDEPWLQLADKVKDFNITTESENTTKDMQLIT